METLDSRWSCKPALGSAGSTCSITYGLFDPLSIEEINIGELFFAYHTKLTVRRRYRVLLYIGQI